MKRNKNLLPNARKLRKEMTKQERHLWYDFLRFYPVNIYRQRIIENYIVDFYCASAKLVIEIDGSQHYSEDGLKNDETRTNILNSIGLEVIRILNYDVDKNFEAVCLYIDNKIKERMKCF